MTGSSATEPRESGLLLSPPSRGILMAGCPSWQVVLIMERINNSSPKGADKSTLEDALKKRRLAGKFLFKNKAVLEKKAQQTFIDLTELFRIE